MTDAIKMQLSAFVDGELSDAESELLIRRIGRDAELRATVAEYHAIGRIMRAEAEPAGMDRLLAAVREGIEVDESPGVELVESAPTRRLAKPLAGIAIAASVALVGVLSVGQLSPSVDPSDALANSYSTPDPDSTAELEDLNLRHGAVGGNLEALLTTVEIRRQQLDTTADEEAAPSDEVSSDDASSDEASSDDDVDSAEE